MEVLYPRCCGLDVHRNMVVACLSLIEAGERRRRDSDVSECDQRVARPQTMVVGGRLYARWDGEHGRAVASGL